jgi:UDP-3-O-[3-hydroxymyristoyl] glucosamine N-acyltransferase
MVLLKRLKEADSSFRIHKRNGHVKQITTLCSLDRIHKDCIVFVKSKNYYKNLIDKYGNSKDLSNIGIVFQESFYKTESDAGQFNKLNQFRFFATVESVDLAVSRFSKLFFDEINKMGNDLEDGRQTGTAKVHTASSLAKNVFLGEKVEIAANVTIHAGCVILSNSKIGENTVLYPNVTIYRNVTIGKDCRIHGNTTIGSDGYGYNYYQGNHLKVWHFGGVIIGDSVEIGSGTSIDQGTFSPTIIGEGTKIDNQVHVAHNCKIGKGVLITGQAGFSGSVTLGDYVVMGGCAQFAPGVVIGNYAQIGGMAGVTSDVPEKAIFAGHPARPLKDWLKSVAFLRRISLKDRK